MFDLAVTKLMPEQSHTKLPGLCKTRWVERHTCFEVFLELYEPLVTFLDAILYPDQYPRLRQSSSEPNSSWDWDKDTRVKAQGLKASLSSFQTISKFLITKYVLDEVKSLSVKLQKRDQDLYEALQMVNSVVTKLSTIRTQIDTIFPSWYTDVLQLADEIGTSEAIPRKTALQRNRSNTTSSSPQEHYKRIVAIPLLDSLIVQLEERFNKDQNQHLHALLSLIPSVLHDLDSQELLPNNFCFWREDLPYPKSLAGELERWKRLWNGILIQ